MQQKPNDAPADHTSTSSQRLDKPPDNAPESLDPFENGLFGNIAQMFVNPTDLQKQIESQLEEIMRQMDAADVFAGFPAPEQDPKLMRDEELKGEDFKRLLGEKQGPLISTSPSIKRRDALKTSVKVTDDERVMDLIHGTVQEQTQVQPGMSSNLKMTTEFNAPPGHSQIDIWNNGEPGRQFKGVITTTTRCLHGVSTSICQI